MEDKQQIAVLSGGAIFRNGDVFFLGMSMLNQKKLQGDHLKAVVELYKNIKTPHKFVYLVDTLQSCNTAAEAIFKIASKLKPAKDGIRYLTKTMLIDPSCFHETHISVGNAWVANNKRDFAYPSKIHKIAPIIRHKDIAEPQDNASPYHFEDFYAQAIEWYASGENEDFTRLVNITVDEFLKRNHTTTKIDQYKLGFKVKRSSEPGSDYEALSTSSDPSACEECIDSLMNKAVSCFVEYRRSYYQSERTKQAKGEIPSLFDNLVYHHMVKLSMSYVLSELAGFHIAAKMIKAEILTADPARTKVKFHYVYPGKLDFIRAYFKLTDIDMVIRPVEFKEVVSSFDDTCSSSSCESYSAISSKLTKAPHRSSSKSYDSKSTVPQQVCSRGNTQKISHQSVTSTGVNPKFWSVFEMWVVCMIAANPNYQFDDAWKQFVNTLQDVSKQNIPEPTSIFCQTFQTWLTKKFAIGGSCNLSDVWGQFQSTLEATSSQKVYKVSREFYHVFEIWLSRKIETDNDFSFQTTWEKFLKTSGKEAEKNQSLHCNRYEADETTHSQELNK